MIRSLLSVRFRSLANMFLARNAKKKNSIGTIILFAFIYLYLGAIMCGMSGFLFYTLSTPYHLLGLNWLYFAMAGMISLAMAVIANVFITQNQLYEAKDNSLLLSMPIPAPYILMTRMIPLLIMNLLFVCVIMLPAIVVYAVWVEFNFATILIPLIFIPAITLLAQAISCIFGWLLHLMMSRINKSLASGIFLVVFLAAYFSIYGNANKLLASLLTNSQAIANTISSWIWPIYAMGKGSIGSTWHTVGFLIICAVTFALLYWILSVTFLRTATLSFASKKSRKLNLTAAKSTNVQTAIIRKDLMRFVGSPVYLTNMGLGILFSLVLAVCGVIFKDKVNSLLQLTMLPEETKPLIICAMLSFLISTTSISAPSVSMEGKNLWILKSLPLNAWQILQSKLNMHLLLTIPVISLTGLVLAITYECSPLNILFCLLIPALMCILSGLLGMISGTKWANFDYQNDVYPCKQSIFVAITMFGMMGLSLALGLLYGYVLYEHISATTFLALSSGILLLLCTIFYQIFRTFCPKMWDTF